MAMLEVKGLEVYYGVIQAIKGISFDVFHFSFLFRCNIPHCFITNFIYFSLLFFRRYFCIFYTNLTHF